MARLVLLIITAEFVHPILSNVGRSFPASNGK